MGTMCVLAVKNFNIHFQFQLSPNNLVKLSLRSIREDESETDLLVRRQEIKIQKEEGGVCMICREFVNEEREISIDGIGSLRNKDDDVLRGFVMVWGVLTLNSLITIEND